MSSFKYIVAIVAPGVVEPLERKLSRIGAGGMTLTRVKGFGEYKNFYARDWLTDHTKVEIFAEESAVDRLVDALRDTAGCSVPGSGIVAVLPVERFLPLCARSECASGSDADAGRARHPA